MGSLLLLAVLRVALFCLSEVQKTFGNSFDLAAKSRKR